MDARNANVATLYNRLVILRKNPESKQVIPVYDEIIFKSTGDTSDDNVKSQAFKLLERKVELINAYKRKNKINLFENELYLANWIIQYIFAPEYMLNLQDEKIVLEKKVEK